MFRSVLVTACVIIAGCSGSDAGPSEATVVAVATTDSPAANPPADVSAPLVERSATPVVWSVDVEVRVDAAGIDDVVAVEVDPSLNSMNDPFTEFASCSGLRAAVGTYAVSAVSTVGTVESVSVLSSERAVTPGVHDAEVRVEPRVGAPISAVGTLTLDDGLRSGSFLAFDLDGQEVSGRFTCSGGDGGPPEPLVTGADDGVLDAVEVVALLRRGDAERVVSLAAPADAAIGATVRCPGAGDAAGAGGAEIVHVDGDQRIGSISTFELVDGTPMTMRLHVGSAVLDFESIEATIDPSGAAGVFNATGVDGVTVDGAFRCT